MKSFKFLRFILVLPLFWVGLTSAAVVNSAHDLSLGSGGNAISGDAAGFDSGQVCVFCHTPHDSNTTQVIPLWNRTTTATASFTAYSDNGGGTFTGANEALTPANAGVSLACLSCHDGTVAMNSLTNAPGSGNLWGTITATTTNSTMDTGTYVLKSSVLLGTDLSNDHPVAVEFGGGGCTDDNATICNTANGKVDTGIADAAPDASGQYWADVDAGGTYSAADVLPLYLRDLSGAGGDAASLSIECATCHDVHDDTSAGNLMLLRVSSTDSAICTSCHINK